jgi:2-iminobutanoate/2-iminopropanoate deaminase
MKAKFPIGSITVVCAGLLLGGCETVQHLGFLVPQGPGNAPDGVVRRAPQPAAQAQAQAPAPAPVKAEPAQRPPNSRSLDVTPELIATAPVPPVRASTDPAAAPSAAYTQSTRYGDLLFISGQIPLDLRTNTLYDGPSIEEQTRVVMENIRLILESNRLTMANIVATTVYLKNVNDLRAMNSVYDGYFKGAPPARTVVEVNKLPRGVALQISAVAGR